MKKTKGILLKSLIAALLVAPTSVYAREGNQYVPHSDKNGLAIMIREINPTDNTLSFSVDTSMFGDNKLTHFGAGWITDYFNEKVQQGILSYADIDTDYSKTIFWNSDDINKYLFSSENGIDNYLVNIQGNLVDNTFRNIYYVAEFNDGQRYVNNVYWGDCWNDWQYGMTCKDFITRIYDYENVVYAAVEKPEIKDLSDELNNKTEADNLENKNEIVDVSNQDSPSEQQNQNNIDNDSKDTIDNTEPVDKTTETVEVVVDNKQIPNLISKYSYDGFSNESTDDNYIEDMEVDEGTGETTLEVPLLGNVNNTDNLECNNNSIYNILLFVAGAICGAILTLVLLSIYIRHKKNDDIRL